MLTVTKILPIGKTLNFLPDSPIPRGRFYLALAKVLGWSVDASPSSDLPLSAEVAIRLLIQQGAKLNSSPVDLQQPLTIQEVRQLVEQLSLNPPGPDFTTHLPVAEPITHRITARLLWKLQKSMT